MSISSMYRAYKPTISHWITFTKIKDGEQECQGCGKTSGVTRYTNNDTGKLIGYACSNKCARYAFGND